VLEATWNWSVLWKPTIDAVGAIVGEGLRPFHPLDDRIVRLAMHCARVRAPRQTSLAFWWRAVS